MRFDQVSFRYARRSRWALSRVDAVVPSGATVVVLGRNGAGKSTLLQLAAGVLRPTSGTIHDRPPVVGWVPERFPAEQPFTAAGYLRRMAAIRGAPASAVDRWIERLLLTEHAGTRLTDLSKGTAQKVGLAQALLDPPGLLVLDEPWEGLDAAARTLVPGIVAEVTATGGRVLVSDHRGEIDSLPGAIHWTVAESIVTEDRFGTASPLIDVGEAESNLTPTPTPAPDRTAGGREVVVIELAVPRDEAARTVADLTAAGHAVIGVREEGS